MGQRKEERKNGKVRSGNKLVTYSHRMEEKKMRKQQLIRKNRLTYRKQFLCAIYNLCCRNRMENGESTFFCCADKKYYYSCYMYNGKRNQFLLVIFDTHTEPD